MKSHSSNSVSESLNTDMPSYTQMNFGSNAERQAYIRSLNQEELSSSQGERQTRAASLGMGQSSKSSQVKVRLNGASISPPEFQNGLPELHDWLMNNQERLLSWAGDIEVIFSGDVQQREQVIWAYYHPEQRLVLKGRSNAVVSGFRRKPNGKKNKKSATPGYFLAYRPIIPQVMKSGDPNNPTITPAEANIKMVGLTIEGYVSGGVEISPRHGTLPNAEAYNSPEFNAEAGHEHGGLIAFMSGAVFKNNTFRQMGTKYQKKGNERYNREDPEAYKYAGYGGILARGLSHSQFKGNEFENLINRSSNKKNETPNVQNTKVLWERLIHGIYLRDNSSDNTILNNEFDGISGAPIKFTNEAHRNKVRKNSVDNAGIDAFVLEHYNQAYAEFNSAGYSNKKIKRHDDRLPYIHDNDLGRRFNKNEGLDLFREKAKK